MTKKEIIDLLKQNIVMVNGRLYTLNRVDISDSFIELMNDTVSEEFVVIIDVLGDTWVPIRTDEFETPHIL